MRIERGSWSQTLTLKGEAQLDMQTLHRVWDRLVAERTR
jgi:hypothetical protein